MYIYFENISMYFHVYIYILIIDIIYKYFKCINLKFFLNIYMHVLFLYIYIIIYTVHTHILCIQKLLFWMRLIAINRLTALIYIYI